MTLAVAGYGLIDGISDSDQRLDLRWTSDERAALRVDFGDLFDLREETAEVVLRYRVADPYGTAALRDAVSHFFAIDDSALSLVTGAGVSSLLYSLAFGLERNRPTLILGDVYPDFPHWRALCGSQCVRCADIAAIYDAVTSEGLVGPIIFVEHPNIFDRHRVSAEAIEALASFVDEMGGLIIVDESNANYSHPRESLARLLVAASNIIVLRGFSKLYSAGGIRCGLALFNVAMGQLIATLVPPLAVASFSLELAGRLLNLGDVAWKIRPIVMERRDQLQARFSALSSRPSRRAGGYLPYVFVENEDVRFVEWLEAKGIVGKPHGYWPEGEIMRYSVPLLDARFDRMLTLLGN